MIKQLPLVMCIMSRHHKEDYVAVMQSIKNLLEQSNVQKFVLDFEDATWRSLERVFLDVEVRGMHFTLHKPFGAISKNKGCSVHTQTMKGHYKFLRKVMGLCYVPAQHLSGIYQRLVRESP